MKKIYLLASSTLLLITSAPFAVLTCHGNDHEHVADTYDAPEEKDAGNIIFAMGVKDPADSFEIFSDLSGIIEDTIKEIIDTSMDTPLTTVIEQKYNAQENTIIIVEHTLKNLSLAQSLYLKKYYNGQLETDRYNNIARNLQLCSDTAKDDAYEKQTINATILATTYQPNFYLDFCVYKIKVLSALDERINELS